MAVTRSGNTIRMTDVNDTVAERVAVQKVTFFCQAVDFQAALSDSAGFVHISGSGRQFTMVNIDFPVPIYMDGLVLSTKTATIPAVYVYVV